MFIMGSKWLQSSDKIIVEKIKFLQKLSRGVTDHVSVIYITVWFGMWVSGLCSWNPGASVLASILEMRLMAGSVTEM